MTKKTSTRGRRGFALLSAATLMAIVLAGGALLVSYLVNTRKAAKKYESTVISNDLAEAGINKAIYCLNAASGAKCGGTFGDNYAGESNVAFGNGTFTVTLTGSGSKREISSTGRTGDGKIQKVEVTATTEPDSNNPAFHFALAAGTGGVYIGQSSTVNGPLIADSDIVCGSANNSVINGEAKSTKTGGKIDNCKIVGTTRADKILNSKVTGSAYYKTNPDDISGTTVSGTKYANSPTPTPENLPDIDLNFWHASAERGTTINGDYAPADNTKLGPARVNGNLTLGNGIDVLVQGPIWVNGDIYMDNNSSFSLDPKFGKYGSVILADKLGDAENYGHVTVKNGAGLYGTGQAASHILLISTSSSDSCDDHPAIRVGNNSAGAAFLTTAGCLKLENGASANSIGAKKLYVDNTSTVNFIESEFTDASFTSGPGGSWRIAPGTWREKR